jgi:acyl-homoserine lactone acylase PvdQ
MKRLALLLVAACSSHSSQPPSEEVTRWKQHASNVTITRDDWGIPHIHGKTDADAVFGMLYAQAEDDFNRVETNYINAMGRLAEVEGESQIYRDLRMKLFINPDSMKAQYQASPAWLKALMDAFADGLNYYLYRHPEVTPRLIKRFEPWMALTFSEGSIGGDIEHVSLTELEAFSGKRPAPASTPPASEARPKEPSGSNGIAIAPSNTAAHHALLLINPHTSFFFRAELQVTSDEGLNSYGATTWGQFFIYQGFNERVGWMHTTSSVDDLDEYLETIVPKGDGFAYRYGSEERPVASRIITVPYKTPSGMTQKQFTVYRTHHGPVIREAGGKWVTIRLMQEPVKALTQSYSRTKARDYRSFRETMEPHTNSSNNTVFASADGDIAYFNANFVPKRNPRFDWSKPVDGSDPATEWQGLHSIDESPHLLNPHVGWLYNTNDWPYSAAGPDSPKKADYPAYMDAGAENFRGIHATRVLQNKHDFTLSSLIEAAYDSYLPAFAELIPSLLSAYDHTPASNPLKSKVADQIGVLRQWDYRWGVESVPTSVAIFWGEEIGRRVRLDAEREDLSIFEYITKRASPAQKLEALAAAADKLTADFGTWRTPWGDINRFQRLTDDIVHPFSDAGPSIPVGFTSSLWGSLAAFGARPSNGTKKYYGTSGNSFVAVVEFGDSVRARAVTAGGESGNPSSPHFNDQAVRYSKGDLREVYFYPAQLTGHTEKVYHPGE